MTLIVFKDANGNPLALNASSVVKASHINSGSCEVTYRFGDKTFSDEVSHPVMEVVEAINKVTGSWL